MLILRKVYLSLSDLRVEGHKNITKSDGEISSWQQPEIAQAFPVFVGDSDISPYQDIPWDRPEWITLKMEWRLSFHLVGGHSIF